MRKLLLLPATITFLGAACSQDGSEELAALRTEIADLRAVAGPPPSSLDSLYPPAAASPVFLQEMLGLSHALTGVAVDLSEQDVERARDWFERFRSQYAAVSRLVPEWAEAYPTEPVDQLAAALAEGDPEQIGAALAAVGAVCHDCHVVNMAKVQYRYRWGDFSSIQLIEPVTGRELGFKDLMREMETAFVGISVDLEEGQLENARAQFATFRDRIRLLAGACAFCHTTERKYFVDKGVLAAVDRLGSVLERDAPDAEAVGRLGQEIGMESCAKCHLVHGPAALVKAQWEAHPNPPAPGITEFTERP